MGSCNRGVPALVFGSLWYQGCKSVFTITSIEDMQDAMNKIISGFKPIYLTLKNAEAIIVSSNKLIDQVLNIL